MNDSSDRGRRPGVVFLLCLAACATVIAAAVLTVGRGMLCLLLVPALLIGFQRRARATPPWRVGWLAVVAATVLVFGAHTVKLAWSNARDPQDWDVQIFALYGGLAARGSNPYAPEVLRTVAAAGSHSKVFVGDLLGDGFPGQGEYAPPLLFLFPPFFGWLAFPTASILWYLAGALVIAADVTLLWRLLLPGSGAAGLLVVAALVLAFRPTQATVALGQYNFLALLMVLLYWRDRMRARSGLWLGLGSVVRSPLASLVLDPLHERRWRTVLVAVATVLGLWGLATTVFGTATVAGYFHSFARMPPAAVFAETINQSLFGASLRTMNVDRSAAATLLNPLYLGVGALLLAATLALLSRLPRRTACAAGLTLPLGLMLHPSILEHYSVLLLFPLLMAWSHAAAGPLARRGVVFLTIEWTLIGSGDGQWVFVATALCWLWFAAMAARGRVAAEVAAGSVR